MAIFIGENNVFLLNTRNCSYSFSVDQEDVQDYIIGEIDQLLMENDIAYCLHSWIIPLAGAQHLLFVQEGWMRKLVIG